MRLNRATVVFAVGCLALAFVVPAGAQQAAESEAVATPSAGAVSRFAGAVLTLDRERLYTDSEPGKAAQARFEQASAALVAENRTLEAALEAEERSLTELRATLPAADFRRLASEFDTKVEELRRAQDAKSRALTRTREDERQTFFEAAVPVLGRLMVDLEAVAIIDRSAIILIFDQLDVTDLAIERLNAELPATAVPLPSPLPQDDATPAEPKPPAP
ncbi:OmpH family outer membrane protein [Pseudotabrizicola sp. L79]|uniref:OmpH family outer membrane protein n=1 Tax=Pseudotabrizicola sp. L79 TaxID=3118402 RepID=UPI002F923C04